MDTTFEVERAPLVLDESPKSYNNKSRVVLSTVLGAIATVALVCFIGYSMAGNNTWMTEKTPNVLKVLPVLNRMVDMVQTTDSLHSQVSQIKYRADSIDNLAKDSQLASNIGIIKKSWEKMLENATLTKSENTVAESLLNLLQHYENVRKVDPMFKNMKTVQDLEKNLSEIKIGFQNIWNTVRSKLTVETQTMKQVALFDKLRDAFDMESTTLCKDQAWYKRWWNTVCGWFGSKPDCVESYLFLESTPTTSCSKLAWYKRWWNTVKGWFGSKPTNCVEDIDLEAVATTACKDLAWYKRWWNTVKGWFGSKPTNCVEEMISLAAATASGDASLPACSSLPWYRNWWSSMKGMFGSSKGCTMATISVDLAASTSGSADPTPHTEQAALQKLCQNRQWYDKWWATVKSWFGNNVKCQSLERILQGATTDMENAGGAETMSTGAPPAKTTGTSGTGSNSNSTSGTNSNSSSKSNSNSSTNSSSDSENKKCPWYKDWWNTVKGWFGGKNECKDMMLVKSEQTFNEYKEWFGYVNLADDSKASNLCKDRAWYTKAWDWVKGVFGSKKTCVEAIYLGYTGSTLCKDLAWYKRWWNTVKGWFGSKPDNCVNAILLADGTPSQTETLPACSDLVWYKKWWNTMKGWFGSNATNCTSLVMLEDTGATVSCDSLAWYKKYWSTVKGWFGADKGCTLAQTRVIKSANENNAALQTLLSKMDDLVSSTNVVMTPVVDTARHGSNEMIDLVDTLADHAERLQPVPNDLHQFNLKVSDKESWFKKFAEVFREKGLSMELYEKPVAEDLLEKVPSFVDGEAKSEGIKFLDNFEKAKSVIIANDKFDKEFLSFFEKLIMTWASTDAKDMDKLSQVYDFTLTTEKKN